MPVKGQCKEYLIDDEIWTIQKHSDFCGTSINRSRQKLNLYEQGKMSKDKLFAPVNKKKSWYKGKSTEKSEYTCKRRDVVVSNGKRYSVAEIISQGDKAKKVKAYIVGNFIFPDNGQILTRTTKCLETNWKHCNG